VRIDARPHAVGRPGRAGADEVLAGASAATDDATAPAVVVRLEVGAGVAVAARLGGEFAALAPARDIAVQRVATPTGVVAEPRLVPAERAGATSPGRPRRPRGTRLRARHIQQRPHREQDRDQPKHTSSYHGSFLSVVWSQEDGAASSDVVTLFAAVMEGGRPVEEA